MTTRKLSTVSKERIGIQGISLFVHPVRDIARATELYRKLLGVDPYMNTTYYAGFKIGDQEIGLDVRDW